MRLTTCYHVLLQARENDGFFVILWLTYDVDTGEIVRAWHEEERG